MIEGFMSQSDTPRVSRVAVGMAVLVAFAVVPFAAQAADTNATDTLSAQPATSSMPGWVWVVLAAGAGVLITLSVAVWKLARRPARAVA
jgi:hypothetical protein